MKSITVEGKAIAYKVYGSGKAIVLLHGFAEDNNVWSNQIKMLETNYTLIMPDLPGSGASERLDNTSMESLAEVVKLMLDNEKIKTAVIIGHSMGGYITLAFAEKYAEYLSGFGLFHSTAFADTDEKKETRRKGIEFIKNNGAYLFIKQSTPNLFSGKYKSEHADQVAAFIEHQKNFNPESLIAYQQAMIARPDRTPILKTSSLPVLLIIGKNDNAVPYKDSLTLSHMAATTYVTILEDSAHMGMMEETEKSNKALLEYLEGVWRKD